MISIIPATTPIKITIIVLFIKTPVPVIYLIRRIGNPIVTSIQYFFSYRLLTMYTTCFIVLLRSSPIRIRKEFDENSSEVIEMAKVSDALAHPVRITILKYVLNKKNVRNDVCNSDLVKMFDYSQSTISQHVKKMVNAGLFVIVKRDKFTLYSVNQDVLDRYIDQLKNM